MTVTSFRDREEAQVDGTERKKKTNNAINNSVFTAIKTKNRKNSSPKKLFADSDKGVTFLFHEDERSLNYSR